MKLFTIILFSIVITFNVSLSDQRSFVWTYEYMIMEPGEAEFEQYTTFSASDQDNFEGNVTSELNFELEIGMNEYFDFNEDDLILLATITTYCTKQRYPSLDKKLPSKDEIKKVKDFSIYLFDTVCNILEINKDEVI